MYERFTDRARKVMQLANQEAQRFNQEVVSSEHILLGLVKEGSGIAATVLSDLDIDLRKVRKQAEKLANRGPEMVTMGKLPLSTTAKHVLESAIQVAIDIGDRHVGTEHILLGLLRNGESIVTESLAGVTFNDVLELVEIMGGKKVDEPTIKQASELPQGTSEQVNRDRIVRCDPKQTSIQRPAMKTCKHCKKQVSGSHSCEVAQRTIYESDSGDFLTSFVIGAMTDSSLLGGIIGGDIVGGMLGDMMDGELF